MKSIFKKIITFIIQSEARLVLKKYKPKIVAVTGSVGKTSTKDAIYSVLSTSGHVRKSQKSFNSEIGVPLTILGCENAWSSVWLWFKNIFYGLELILFKVKYPETLVLEVGADHPGDIQRITSWLKPDVVVMTKISLVPVHVEFFPSRENLVVEKSYLARALKKNGTLILSEDDEDVKKIGQGMSQKTLTFGLSFSSSVSASHESIIYEEKNGLRRPIGMSFKLNYSGNSLPITIHGVLGVQQIYPLIAAAAVGISFNILLTTIVESLNKHVASKGRMNIISGINESTIIDDSYNSSPDALREALITLSKVECTGKKVAILGDMLELGKYSVEEHKKAGDLAHKVSSVVITVGQRAQMMGGELVSFNNSEEAGQYARGIIERGDVVLVKGSQSMRMEKVVKVLMAEPEKAGEVLVRQEEEWLSR